MKRNMMITWLLLVSLICSQDGNGQENGVLNCGPQNLTLTGHDRMILSTWEDDPSCSAVHDVLTYQLEVLIADNRVHYEEVAVTPDQIGSTHSWNWTSHVALECASHSVRLTSRYKNHTSPREQRMLAGMEISKNIQVFPQDRALKVGSTVTFCCLVPAGDVFRDMYVFSYNNAGKKISNISSQIYTMTVRLTQPSGTSSTDVVCQTNKAHNGASNLIGYPPFDRDLECETRDLESVECQWTIGEDTHISFKFPTRYHLDGSPCADQKQGTCSKKVQVEVGEKNWTVTAENELGMVELSDTADLTKRVHLLAPKEITVPTVNARNVTLVWKWPMDQYNNLNITCQVNSQGETQTISGVGLRSAVLNNLIPNWPYEATVRCGTTQDFWKWNEWSSVKFRTKGDVPDALDVWMKVKDNQTIITWKTLLANQSHGDIKDYEVTWAKTSEIEQPNKATVDHKNRLLSLSLDATEEYIVTVTARNINGSSPPSTITIPSLSPESSGGAERVNTTRIIGSNGSFNLSWSASPAVSCGYIVDWCPTFTECEVEWLKVPSETSASIRSEQFTDGVRYSLSVYACTQGAPVLLDRREGYVSEERIADKLFTLRVKQRYSDLEVSWDPIDPRNLSAFIQGYVLSCLDDSNDVIHNFSTDNPEATSLTIRSLKFESYTCTVKARTSVGECGTTTVAVTLITPTDDLIKPTIIAMVTVFGLLSLITVLCYRHWPGIKQKIYPPIPKPVLTDEWMKSPGENNCRPLCVDQHHHSEVDIMDVPVEPCNQGQANTYIFQENVSVSQTPSAAPCYYNQLPNNCNPPTSTLSTTVVPSKLGIPSLFSGAFPNLSYNLMTPTDEHTSPGPELQGGTTLEISSSGYQPQRDVVNQTEEELESPMIFDSTYILFPRPPSK